MEKLDEYSGLGSFDESKRHQIENIECSTTTCIVNVEGDIVWDIRFEETFPKILVFFKKKFLRMQLYSEQMVQHIEEAEGDVTVSLDGCLNSTTVDDYNTCMQQVRTRMTSFLEQFDQLFKNELEKSCDETLFSTNCITLLTK